MRADALGLFWEDKSAEKSVKVEKVKREPPEPTWLLPDYLPYLEESLAFNVPLMTDQEIIECAVKRHPVIFDIECYVNYFLIAFKSQITGKVFYLEKDNNSFLNTQKLRWIMENMLVVGFNSNSYDIPMATLAIHGLSCAQLKEASDKIIQYNVRSKDLFKEYKAKKLKQLNHIDLIEVAPSMCSLKIYGGRMHTKRMQDLPFVPNTVLSPEQVAITRFYCVNDLEQTVELYESLKAELTLRTEMTEEYGIDLRSKSDAQIAEAVIAHEIEKITGTRPQKPEIAIGTAYKYYPPAYMRFQTPLMNSVLDIVRRADFVVGDSGAVGMPAELKSLKIRIGNSVYKMGIGGLHSTESAAGHVAGGGVKLIDRDVTSYYPFIILNQGLYPKHLGTNFLSVYNSIVQRRLAAKRAGNKKDANSLKIVINGSFGKLGSKYSILYSPDLLIQVTISGQLNLLMLIEQIELAGINVVSANTDGIVIKCPDHMEETLNKIVKWWEQVTNFETEDTEYLALYSRDVNSYMAVKKEQKDGIWLNQPDPKEPLKTKGALANTSLQVNPSNEICVEAIRKLLLENKPVHETINECQDIRKFLNVRSVNGGAVKSWDRLVPEHSSKEELLSIMGFSEISGGNYRHGSWAPNSHASLERAYEYALQMCPPGRNDYLGKAIRWYYGKDISGEIVYAKNGNKVPRSEGAVPLMELPKEFPKNVDKDWYINETYNVLKGIGYYTD